MDLPEGLAPFSRDVLDQFLKDRIQDAADYHKKYYDAKRLPAPEFFRKGRWHGCP